MAGSNAQGDGAPADRYFLERRLNENSTDWAHLGYPGYPNEAGVAWINMVKGKFQSNITISNIPNLASMTYARFLYFGKYDLKVVNNGEILHEVCNIKIELRY